MQEKGRSMVAIAVDRALRSAERRGAIRMGLGRYGPESYARASFGGWVPGMGDDGGMGPIPQRSIDAIAEDVAQEIERQLELAYAAEAEAAERANQPKPKKRPRPSWLRVVKGEPVEIEDGEADSEQPAAPTIDEIVVAEFCGKGAPSIDEAIVEATKVIKHVPDVDPEGLVVLGGGPREDGELEAMDFDPELKKQLQEGTTYTQEHVDAWKNLKGEDGEGDRE